MGSVHAKYSASGSSQWLNCSGVIGMKSLVPPPEQSEAAALGTAAHELLEICLKNNEEAYEHEGAEIFVNDKAYVVDDNMIDAVQQCIDVARSYMDDYPHAEIMLEQRVDISSIVDSDMFGTVDIRIAIPYEKLIIIDYKHGSGVPVEVEDNTQLIYYALGSALEDDFEFESVEMVIVQPRCPHPDGAVRSYELTMEGLTQWISKFKDGVEKAKIAEEAIKKKKKPIAKYVDAGSWCKFCPATAICPARHKQAVETAQLEWDDYEELTMKPKKDPPNLATEEMLSILKNGAMIKDYIDEVTAYAQNLLEAGTEVPGYKLVKKRAYAKFNSDDEEIIGKLVSLGYDHDKIARTKLETITKLRKICGKEVIDKLTHIPDTGNIIAPISDKRPSVEPSVFSDFEDD